MTTHNATNMIDRTKQHPRRGTALILVAGLLVLLVIIATAYIGRTNTDREVARAQQTSSMQQAGGEEIGDDLAGMIGNHLFIREVDRTYVGADGQANQTRLNNDDYNIGSTAKPNANVPREAHYDQQIMFGRDTAEDNAGNPTIPFPTNYAPYHVVPWTNVPDDLPVSPFNDVDGDPGFGDHRWLADTEPLRVQFADPGDPNAPTRERFAFWRKMTNVATPYNGWNIVADISNINDNTVITNHRVPAEQWPTTPVSQQQIHLDESDPESYGRSYIHESYVFDDSDAFMNDFWLPWFREFGPVGTPGQLPWRSGTYGESVNPINDGEFIPANHFRLSDLNATGVRHDYGVPDGQGELVPQDTPQAEFVRGTARWNVSRVLTDADGDGFTDSFWFLPPTPVKDGVRQIVGVRVVDGSALLNVNTATRFVRNDGFTDELDRTIGTTPADVALVGQGEDVTSVGLINNWNTGLLDNPLHHAYPASEFTNPDLNMFGGLYVALRPDFFNDYGPGNRLGFAFWLNPGTPGSDPDTERRSYIRTTGLWDAAFDFPAVFGNVESHGYLMSQSDRLSYWEALGRNKDYPLYGLTPFGMESELSLRMHHGNNTPWLASRLESAVQANIQNATGDQPLRASITRNESNERLAQLNSEQLVLDLRRKLTTHSGARNDLMPPWLWIPDDLTPGIEDTDDPYYDQLTFDQQIALQQQRRQKFDLRGIAPHPDDFGSVEANLDSDPWDPGAISNEVGFRYYARQIRDRIEQAFIFDPDDYDQTGNVQSYFGSDSDDVDAARRMAASFAANILTWRTRNVAVDGTEYSQTLTLDEAVPTSDEDEYYIGMERQPFLLEAFIAHVHASKAVPQDPDPGSPWDEFPGDRYVTYSGADDDSHETVVVVQIANPFDEPVNLEDYKIVVMSDDATTNVVDLATLNTANIDSGAEWWPLLPPGTPENPRTAIFYAIADEFDGDGSNRQRWLDFLDLNYRFGDGSSPDPTWQDHPDGTIVANVGNGWSRSRNYYDNSTAEHSAALYRKIPRLDGSVEDVLVDRFDPPDDVHGQLLGDAFDNKANERIQNLHAPPPPTDPDPDPDVASGIALDADDDYWVAWVRVSRPWGVDFNRSADFETTVGIQANERAPWFIMSRQTVEGTAPGGAGVGSPPAGEAFPGVPSNPDPPDDGYWGDSVNRDEDPDSPWFSHTYDMSYALDTLERKPTFFNNNPVFDGTGDIYPEFYDATRGYGTYFYDHNTGDTFTLSEPSPLRTGVPDKGYEGDAAGGMFEMQFPMQMLQKDGDFQQLGELNLIWLWGHELDSAFQTRYTFSEYLSTPDWSYDDDDPARVGRLNPGFSDNALASDDPFIPGLPAATRVLDAFVLDGPGTNDPDLLDIMDPLGNGDQVFFPHDTGWRYGNAMQFAGRLTQGLININTAPVEVLRSLPHMSKLVYAGDTDEVDVSEYPRTAAPEAMIQYRETLMEPNPTSDVFTGYIGGPDYTNRGSILNVPDLRETPGFASVGEPQLLREGGSSVLDRIGQTVYNDSWRIDFSGFVNSSGNYNDPYGTNPNGSLEPGPVLNNLLSTDVNPVFDPDYADPADAFVPDRVAGDVEEANMLYSGISNLITTRSDVFTVYFRVRSFEQQPNGTWDATDRDRIISDTRYVMVVDRSNVRKPGDDPEILLFQKLPN